MNYTIHLLYFYIIMQKGLPYEKIITRRLFIYMLAAFLVTITAIFALQTVVSQRSNTSSSIAKLEDVKTKLAGNEENIGKLTENLSQDNLAKTRAFADMIAADPSIKTDPVKLNAVKERLMVNELHVIDENGIIVSSSVRQYVGFDMTIHEQTKPFLDLLESGDKEAYLIQEPQPNAAEGNIMQYVGVPRRSQKGVVQVGFKPIRQLEAESRNTYEYIFSKFPTDIGEELFVSDCNTGEILGHSDVKITLNRYVHPTVDTKRNHLNLLDTMYHQYNM